LGLPIVGCPAGGKAPAERRLEDVWAVLDRFAAAAPATLWRETASTRAAGSSSITAR
jgi:hypothetical protein